MEIVELFNASERASLYRYFSTRFKWPVVIALPSLLVILALSATQQWAPWSFSVTFLLALALVVPLRLADDLADRRRDQSRYPDRELCKTAYLPSYWYSLVILLCIAALVVSCTRGLVALVILVAATAVVAIWYKFREALQASAIVNYHVVLTKYISFEWILIDSSALPTSIDGWWYALTAYGALLLWEVLHDETNRLLATARRLAVLEFAAWLVWTLWIL